MQRFFLAHVFLVVFFIQAGRKNFLFQEKKNILSQQQENIFLASEIISAWDQFSLFKISL